MPPLYTVLFMISQKKAERRASHAMETTLLWDRGERRGTEAIDPRLTWRRSRRAQPCRPRFLVIIFTRQLTWLLAGYFFPKRGAPIKL